MISLLLAGCTPEPRAPDCQTFASTPSDDPADWNVGPGSYTPVLSDVRFVVPSDALPVTPQASNNNVSILVAEETLFLAWRTAPSHFADVGTEMHVVSSTDDGAHWDFEHTIALGSDVREPALLLLDGQVSLHFFQGGTNPFAFEPRAIWRSVRCAPGEWTDEIIEEGDDERVVWDLKVRDGRPLRTSYTGDHYGKGELEIHLETSDDGGATWYPVGTDPTFSGGSSESAIELTAAGDLWAVTRNEDGDATGKGSMLCTAPASDLGAWDCPAVSDPERYDSPELLRHGDELWLLARRDIGGPFGEDGGLLEYSARPKTSALYRIDQENRQVEHVMDIPGAGDTAFPQARRTGPHTFLVANYTSPLDDPDITWLEGQTSPLGTQIYLATLTFE
ncbi:MAG: exo-alpha-sialidase [Alphaproteobacteria bacterium]|nr:exo-alpha-sialidase [Alphaproteobacteria bacterium]